MVINSFYLFVLAGLICGAYYTADKARNWERPPHENVEYKVQLTHPGELKVVVEPAKPAAAP